MNHPYRQILEDSITTHKELLKLQNEVVFFLDRKRNKEQKYRCLEDVQEDILTIETKNKIQTLEKRYSIQIEEIDRQIHDLRQSMSNPNVNIYNHLVQEYTSNRDKYTTEIANCQRNLADSDEKILQYTGKIRTKEEELENVIKDKERVLAELIQNLGMTNDQIKEKEESNKITELSEEGITKINKVISK